MGHEISFDAKDYYDPCRTTTISRANVITYDTSILYDYITSANTVKAVQKGKAFVFSIIDSDTPVMEGAYKVVDSSKYLDPSVNLVINKDTGYYRNVKDIWFRIYHPVENIDISIHNELY